jgi:hypothetical protein
MKKKYFVVFCIGIAIALVIYCVFFSWFFGSPNAPSWTSVIVTFLAVIVALFNETIKNLIFCPELRVIINTAKPNCVKTKISWLENNNRVEFDCYYLRIWVENFGRARAKDVEVFLSKILIKNGEGKYVEVDSFSPMNLKWSYNNESCLDGISPGIGRHCDLAHVIDPKYRSNLSPLNGLQNHPKDKTILELDLVFPLNTNDHLLFGVDYMLEIKISSSNAKIVCNKIKITHTGKWNIDKEKMFPECVSVMNV